MSAAHRADPTLQRCFKNVVSADKTQGQRVAFVLRDNILMRKWFPTPADELDWQPVYQNIVPTVYGQQVLSLAREQVVRTLGGVQNLPTHTRTFLSGRT